MKRRIMVVFPHADDASIFLGGTIINWAQSGEEVILVRITNDDCDCVGIPTRDQAIRLNRMQADAAYAILGAKRVIHLGFTSDTFGAVDFLSLREKLVRLIREIRPDTTVTFAMDGREEENMDHRITAYAMAEAQWVAAFDLHHPEHFAPGITPFSVGTRLYFARTPESNYACVDITEAMDKKIRAILAHKTVMKNFSHQLHMRAASLGIVSPLLESGDADAIVEAYMRAQFGYAKPDGTAGYCEYLYNPEAEMIENLKAVFCD